MTIKYIFAFTFLLALASARYMSGSIPVSKMLEEKNAYFAKFAMQIGAGRVDAKFRFSQPVSSEKPTLKVNTAVYIDPYWEEFLSSPTCKSKFDLRRSNINTLIPTNGDWSKNASQTLVQKIRTHVWFFVLVDCEENLKGLDPNIEILWEANIVNSDGSSLSEEENGVLTLKLYILAIFVIFFVFNIHKFYNFYKTEETFDYPGLCLILVLAVEFWALVFDVLHLWILSSDGIGSYFFNFGSVALHIISQYSLTCVLLLLANGWSFRYMSIDHIRNYSPAAIFLGILQIFLMWLGTSTDDEHDKFHDFENMSGALIILIRLVCFGFFVYLLKETYQQSENEERSFLKAFGFLGSVFFLAFPILVIISSAFVARYLRHKVITIGTQFFLILTMMFLTKMFTNKKNKFYNNIVDVQKMLDIEITSNNKLFTDISS